jgi:hypothetical protein
MLGLEREYIASNRNVDSSAVQAEVPGQAKQVEQRVVIHTGPSQATPRACRFSVKSGATNHTSQGCDQAEYPCPHD